ncbi:MAG: hypothetical protein R2824_33455 [Saprospiraceae bacterium]|nr:hypothetical protein [Lewinella sp.]
MVPPFIEQLQKLIAEDNLEDVAKVLQENGQWLSETTREEVSSLSGRLQQVRQQEWKGTISHENVQLEWNRIREALIRIVQFYARSPEERARVALKKKLKWLIPLVVYLLVTAGLLWWLLQPQSSFKMDADLLVERLTFQYLEGPANFARGKLESCFIQNFDSIELEGDRLLWAKESGDRWNASQDLTSGIVLTANENISGIGVHFGPAQLERLFPAPGALLTFSQSEDAPYLVQMTVHQNEGLRSEWNLQDSMDLEVEMVTLKGVDGVSSFYAPTQMRLFPGKDRAREVRITSFPGTSHFDMEFKANIEIEAQNLLISEPGFYQPLESLAVPTLLAGQIRIGGSDQQPLRLIEISEGEALDVDTQEPLSLKHIGFGEKGITIKLAGIVREIETGRDHESRNPSRIEWLWHTQKWMIAAVVLVLLGLVPFILKNKRS